MQAAHGRARAGHHFDRRAHVPATTSTGVTYYCNAGRSGGPYAGQRSTWWPSWAPRGALPVPCVAAAPPPHAAHGQRACTLACATSQVFYTCGGWRQQGTRRSRRSCRTEPCKTCPVCASASLKGNALKRSTVPYMTGSRLLAHLQPIWRECWQQ